MSGHRLAFLGGGIWHLFRFAFVAAITLRVAGFEPLFHLDVVWVGAPTLLIVALFAGCAFFPARCVAYLPLLRIGTLLTVVTDALVVISGGYMPIVERIGGAGDGFERYVFIIVFGILAADLLIFAALISYRPMERSPQFENDDRLPKYESTDLEDE